jgi:hypothetical protein
MAHPPWSFGRRRVVIGTLNWTPLHMYHVSTDVICCTCLVSGRSVCAKYHIFANRYCCKYWSRFARLSCRPYASFACTRVLLMTSQFAFIVVPSVAANLIPSIVTCSWKFIPSAVAGAVQFAIARAFGFVPLASPPSHFRRCVQSSL